MKVNCTRAAQTYVVHERHELGGLSISDECFCVKFNLARFALTAEKFAFVKEKSLTKKRLRPSC